MTKVEQVARAILRSRGDPLAEDDAWRFAIAHYHRMVAKYPHYAKGGNNVIDAMRDARAAIAAMDPPSEGMAENAAGEIAAALPRLSDRSISPMTVARELWRTTTAAALEEQA